jgi:hypothetical protein
MVKTFSPEREATSPPGANKDAPEDLEGRTDGNPGF